MRFRMMFTAAAVSALSGLSVGAALAQSPAVDANAALDSLVTSKMAEAGIVGLGAALIVDRQVVWMKGYGSPTGSAPGRSHQ